MTKKSYVIKTKDQRQMIKSMRDNAQTMELSFGVGDM